MFGHKRIPSREGGVEIVVEELCTRLVRDGHTVVCYNRAGHHVSGAEYDAKIKNEYDIQHILYALLRTVFPETRKEVNGDNGYSGTRADLYLETYDIIIEIKCTRSSMSVKQLTEELGSDAFHYKTKNLYLFIYDKEDIIKNPEAYQNAFQRDYEKDGKNVQVFITKTLI